jgi:hypothetical protein
LAANVRGKYAIQGVRIVFNKNQGFDRSPT